MKYNDTNRLTKNLYNKIYPTKLLVIILVSINGFIDSIQAGRLLGTEALAVVGLFSPLSNVIYMLEIFVTGTQVICAQYMGRGDTKKLVSLFSTVMVFLTGISLLLTTFLLTFKMEVAGLLGADGECQILLAQYISGYAIGIVGQTTSLLLVALLPLNNKQKLSYVHIGILSITNVSLNYIFIKVLGLGILGLGLATAISYLLPAAIILFTFIDKKKIVHIEFGDLCFNMLSRTAKIGFPEIMFNAGCSLKSYMMNRLLLASGGVAAVAAFSVQGSICSILGAFSLGAAETVLILGSIYYGEEDRKGMEMLVKYAIRTSVIIAILITIGVMASSSAIPNLYYAQGSEAWEVTRRMLLLFPGFLIFNCIFNIILNVCHCQEQVNIVNCMSFLECVLIAVAAAIGMPFLGTDAAWIAFPAAELLCIAILRIIAVNKNTGWLMLKADFGVPQEDCMNLSVHSMNEVIALSEEVVAFCKGKGIDRKQSMIAGLAIEEMAGNVVEHGFADQKMHTIDIRVICKKGGLTIRMRDDCKGFDPVKYVEQFEKVETSEHLGIQMISKLVSEMYYMNNMGMNVLMMKVPENKNEV